MIDAVAALIESSGYVLVFFAVAMGLATWTQVAVFFVLAILLGTFLSVSAVLLQERTRMRVASSGDLLRLLGVSVLENFGYHQLHLLVRIVGTFDDLVRRRKDVGATERHGSYQMSDASTQPTPDQS